MEPIETIAWREIIGQGELHYWCAAGWPGWGFPGPWPKPSPTRWTGMKSRRWYTAAADHRSR